MKIIQVDMFAVGLGAAILSQFKTENGDTVSILADAGVGPGGYKDDEVCKKLPAAWTSFDDSVFQNKRIDLMIGTHYDGDHLKGLIPVAEDDSIEINEVWLPPVNDDEEEIKAHLSEPSGYLADKFFEDDDGSVLLRYLDGKKAQILEAQQHEMQAAGKLMKKFGRSFFGKSARYRLEADPEQMLERIQARSHDLSHSNEYMAFFMEQEAAATARTQTETAHGSASYDSGEKDAVDLARAVLRKGQPLESQLNKLETEEDPSRMKVLPIALANITKSTAAKAITAIHLDNLVQALRKRTKPVRPVCNFIPAGQPSRFVWEPEKSRFIPRAKGGATDLILTLLGPSDKLVEKHRDKIPVGAYRIAFQTEPITLEGITESNQLSYILTLERAGQRLLISGDAGCYDFKDEKKKYFPDLLNALSPLHVVQIAHHAGRNYDFYPTLLAAGFAEQNDFSYLLLSHAVADRTRPSPVFGNFIARIRKEVDDVCLLFTSRPDADKVKDYNELIYKVTPPNPPSDRGDIRLSYSGDIGTAAWVVERHAVAV